MPKKLRHWRSTAESTFNRTELTLVRFALFVAFGISAYLAWNSWQGGGVPGCGPESDCDKVLSSRWAYVLGVPVSAFALPVYGVALGLVFRRRIGWHVLVPFALTVLMAVFWFVGLQLVVLKAVCKFCMAAHLAGAMAAVVLLKVNPLSTRAVVISVLVAATLSSFLIAGQLGTSPPAPLQVVATPPAASNANVFVPQPDPTLVILQGQFTIKLADVPVSGRHTASKKMVKLFDYTCHHCRDLHHLLEPIKTKYSNELAIISLPMPLDSSCNPAIPRTPSPHVNACEYTRIALAVFYADIGKFDEFSGWLFAPQRPPELAQARAYAEKLVGPERFAAALNDPRIPERIRTDGEIYLASSRLAKRGAMPQLIFEQGASIGAVQNAQQLEKILFDALGLGAPPP